MPEHTATVEVLTAEVRVLMVGSRQVTLSVARQLDWVCALDLEPFGRIKLSNADDERDVTVIGSASGTLARAVIHPSGRLCATKLEVYDSAITYCSDHLPLVDPAAVRPRPGMQWKRHYWYVYFSEQRQISPSLYTQFAELPLIVLAGLR